MGQDSLCDVVHTVQIQLELCVRILCIGHLGGAADTVARVVDQYIYATLFGYDLVYSRLYLRFVGNVGCQMLHALGGIVPP